MPPCGILLNLLFDKLDHSHERSEILLRLDDGNGWDGFGESLRLCQPLSSVGQ
jgi:hypothetical protein